MTRPRLRLGIEGGRPALAVLALVTLTACGATTAGATSGTGERIEVVTSTTVFADLVAQVGGDRVDVTPLVPKGGEVHTFDPTPSALRAVAGADLVVLNGLGLDDWVRGLATDSGATAAIIELAPDLEGVEYIEAADEHAEADGEHADEGVNPHLWLDARYAARYVTRIVDALIAADPDAAPGHRERGAAYLRTLDELDTWARERLERIPAEDRVVVSFHEALPYLTRAYGLTIAGTIVDAPGQDPSAGEIAELVSEIRASGARAVFGEVQFSPELVETVATEAGVRVESDLYTDSLGDPPIDTYEGMMRWTIERIAATLEG